MRFGRLSAFAVLVMVAALALSGCFGPKIGSLTGVVEWSSGEVIAGATVKLGNQSTTTNDEGVYSFTNIKPGTYTLVVLQGETLLSQEQIKIEQGENIHNVVIAEDRGSIQGSVVNRAGRPIADATVSIGILETTTDENGHFAFSDLPLGDYEVTVTKDNQQLADAVVVELNGPLALLDPIVGQRLVSSGKSYTYVTKQPSSAYPDTDNKELTDGLLGTTSYANTNWVGIWYSGTVHIDFDLEEKTNIYEVRVHMLSGDAGVFYPGKIAVSVSNDGSTWTPVKEITNSQQSSQAEVRWFTVDELDVAARYVRLAITSDANHRPEGHNMFLSEVEIYE